MIKFFRKIRQKLLIENKFRKYLVYAIGEIILVVIGILIAININNWNESRKASKVEQQLYIKLLNDINHQFRYSRHQIIQLKRYQDVHFHIYNETRGRAQYDSTLYYNSLEWIMPKYLFISTKYTEFLKGITNDTINDLLKEYISREKIAVNATDEWNEFKLQRIRPFFSKHGIHNTEAVFNAEPYKFSSLTILNLIDHSKLKKQYGTTELDGVLFDLRFKTSWVFHNLDLLVIENNRLERELIKELTLNNQSEAINRILRTTLSDLLADEKTIDEIFELLKNDDQTKPIYNVTEDELNNFGYELMDQGRNEDALKFLKLNIELYPDAWNTYDSYGECLLVLGDTINAFRSYKKSIELNPDNTIAENILEN